MHPSCPVWCRGVHSLAADNKLPQGEWAQHREHSNEACCTSIVALTVKLACRSVSATVIVKVKYDPIKKKKKVASADRTLSNTRFTVKVSFEQSLIVSPFKPHSIIYRKVHS